MRRPARRCVGYVVKMFPRVSETFIINEILELERQGIDLTIYTLMPPDNPITHAFADGVRSPVVCVHVTFREAPWTVFAAHARWLFRRPIRYSRMAVRALVSRDHERRLRFAQTLLLARAVHCDGIRHLHAGFLHAPATVVSKMHRLAGTPYSAAAHGQDLYRPDPEELRRKLGRARFVMTCTDYNRRYLESLLGAERVRHAYHGVDLERFRFGPHATDQPPVVLSVARLVPKKGLDTLIESCALLHRRGRVFSCHLVGTGELEDDLRAMVRSRGLEDFVLFEGPLEQQAVREWYHRATLLVLPCRIMPDGNRDGLPNVIVEAAASGLPIVSTPVSGIPELVRHEETGLLVEPSDSAALAGAIERLLDDAELRERLRTSARRIVEERFDQRRTTKAVGDELRSVLEGSEPIPSRRTQPVPGPVSAEAHP